MSPRPAPLTLFALSCCLALSACGVHEEEPNTPAADGQPVAEMELMSVRKLESSVGFAASRAPIGHLGHFENFDAKLGLVDERPAQLEIIVKTGSVVADRSGLTEHLKGPDFFDASAHPNATFVATSITAAPGSELGHYTVQGTMNFHGVEQALEFPAEIHVEAELVRCKAQLAISASAFEIRYAGMEAELAEDLVELEVELVFPRE